jgi:hypothetical protein
MGVLSWVQRIKRVRERVSDLLGDNGWRWRVLRTSNAYDFRDPGAPNSSGTPNQAFFLLKGRPRRRKDTASGGERGSAREGGWRISLPSCHSEGCRPEKGGKWQVFGRIKQA